MHEIMKVLPLSDSLVEAPEYIRVLPLGYVSSEKGDFIVDAESFDMMKTYMEHRAIDIVIDYEHQTLRDMQAPAGGWIKNLFLKNDGIFAKVEWTQKAKEYLKNKEYRYLSPVVLVRKSDRKVSQLHSVALTNTPAINGMIPITNSINSLYIDETVLDNSIKQLCKKLNIKEADVIRYGQGGF